MLLGLLAWPPPGRAQTQSCIDVQVGSARSYDCINRALRRTVGAARAVPQPPSLTATSAPNRVGTFNQAATREYLGSSFGRSAIPQPHLRTYAPSFGAPVHP